MTAIKMQRVGFESATIEQLREFGSNTLGINIHMQMSIERARAMVRTAGWTADVITVAEDEKKAELFGDNPRPVTASQQPTAEGKVKLILSVDDKVGGSDGISVGVNGSIMLVPRDKEVEIPLSYFRVLENAIEHRYHMAEDGLSMNPVAREVKLFPYTLLSQVPPARPSIAA
ncbi:MAG: hypothetical protein E4H01_00530 [Lysobacterales bacterium]|nr:MAG: hypothetical protein E4H01_00530 [Xanthomonadales bacterium]